MQAVTYMVLGSGVAALLLAWMVLVERQRFRVRRVVLDAGSLGLPPLKILHLTDAHFHGRDRPILRFLQGVRAREDFDLLLLTGDMLDSAAGLESVEEVLGMFAPRIGALAVLGGHDYAHLSALKAYRYLLTRRSQQAFSGPNPADDLADCLRRHGARVLRDASATLAATDGRPFAVAGLRDAFVFEPDVDAACQVANDFASEHLQLITADDEAAMGKIRHAGAIFLGPQTPVPLGDYCAGPSHVLPTGGTARFFGPLSVNDFLKASSVVRYDAAALAEDAEDVIEFAGREGLTAHARAIEIRRGEGR